MAVMTPGGRGFVHRNGLRVSPGAFAGMVFPPGLEASSGDLVSKLVGTYEAKSSRRPNSGKRIPRRSYSTSGARRATTPFYASADSLFGGTGLGTSTLR